MPICSTSASEVRVHQTLGRTTRGCCSTLSHGCVAARDVAAPIVPNLYADWVARIIGLSLRFGRREDDCNNNPSQRKQFISCKTAYASSPLPAGSVRVPER